MIFRQIVNHKLAQFSYLIGCESSREAIVIDPQRDVERYIQAATEAGLRIVAAAETHIHADFLSGLRQFATQLKVKVYASAEGGKDWQYDWLIGSELHYRLLKNGDSFNIGSIRFEVSHTPGHTPEHISYAVTDCDSETKSPVGILSGDFIFVGDVGRPDLLETAAGQTGKMLPAAIELYKSLQLVKSWPSECHIWPGHGAGSVCGKSIGAAPSSTVGYELAGNQAIHAAHHESKEEFVKKILEDQPEPPHYFARMKQKNKNGPALLHDFPEPPHMTIEEIMKQIESGGSGNSLLLDCRSWPEYRDGHIAGSLFTPADSSFPTIAGSYIEADTRLYLLIDPKFLNEAITDLIHVGLDDAAGFASPEAMGEYQENGGQLKQVTEIDMVELSRRIAEKDTFVLDVRRAAELKAFGQIAGAANVAHTRLLPDGNNLPRDREIHVHCRSGVRSTYACGFLERSGYDVIHVSGGFLAWEWSGQKVVFPE